MLYCVSLSMSVLRFIKDFLATFIASFTFFIYSSAVLSTNTSSSIVSISTTPSCTFIAHIFARHVAPNFEKLNLPTFESFC